MEKKRGTPKIIVGIIIVLVLILLGWIITNSIVPGGEPVVKRQFSSTTVNQGEEIDVTLSVSIGEGETYYALEEEIPEGWIITDKGEGTTLKWVVIQDVEETTYSYSVRAPSQAGEYTFSGNYMFEDFTEPKTTEGQTAITVI